MAQQLGDKPSQSIPLACGGWADTAGAYRLLSNDSFDWHDVLEPGLDTHALHDAAHGG